MTSQDDPIQEFETRKQDHIRLSLSARNQAEGGSGFDRMDLIHEALPERNLNDVSLRTTSLGHELSVPFLVSSMTAGHEQGMILNHRLAEACARRGWWMGVGSQRRQLFDQEAAREWQSLRRSVPNVCLLGNLGLSQVIETPTEDVQRLVESLAAIAMVVHTNPLQEALQPEGTPQFQGGLQALDRLARSLSVPVILKETGCGFSAATFRRLTETGIGAVDVSGFGGTHWGRIEGERAPKADVRHTAAQAFAGWGISTVDSLMNAREQALEFEVWASGGIRSGVDALKALALGARMVGFAKPALAAALESATALDEWMNAREYELKTALFCTGLGCIDDLKHKQVWQWRKI
jgi:isopentenyl-diphosphate Delta-isomerase